MQNYRLSFLSWWGDVGVVFYTRVITAPNRQWARRIGKAMLGEVIAPQLTLDDFIDATPTWDPPSMSQSTETDDEMWMRVVSRLRLTASRRRVVWVYSWRIGVLKNPLSHRVPPCDQLVPKETVGFEFHSARRNHA